MLVCTHDIRFYQHETSLDLTTAAICHWQIGQKKKAISKDDRSHEDVSFTAVVARTKNECHEEG